MSESVFQNIDRVLQRIEEIKQRFGVRSTASESGFGEILEEKTTSAAEADAEMALPEKKVAASAEGEASSDLSDDVVTGRYNDVISAASERYSIPEPLIRAVIRQESDFRENAVSKKGAQGLMQLMPGTADLLGVEDTFDAEQNIFGGTRYLRELIDLYGGNLNKALAAYNAGPNRVGDTIPRIPETVNYIRSVLDYYNQFSKSKDSEGL